MNNESLEMFFSTLNEKTMDKLIDLYESKDEKGLEAYLDELPFNVPKKDLLEGMKMLIEMKSMLSDFS